MEFIGAMVLGGLYLAVVSVLLSLISAVFILVAWNVGIVGATVALHWPVPSGISYGTAFGLAFLVVVLTRIFGRNETISVDNS